MRQDHAMQDVGPMWGQRQWGSDDSCHNSIRWIETRVGNCTTVQSEESNGSPQETAGYRSERRDAIAEMEMASAAVEQAKKKVGPTMALTANMATLLELLEPHLGTLLNEATG